MKKIMIAFLCAFSTMYSANAQSVNGIPLKDIDAEYIEIQSFVTGLSSKVVIGLNYGQAVKILNSGKSRLKGQDGEDMKFNSSIDALNFLYKNGFEFVNSYTELDANKEKEVFFLLRRKR